MFLDVPGGILVRSAPVPGGDSVGGPVVGLRGDALPVPRGDSARIVIGARVTLTRKLGGGPGPDRRCERYVRRPRPQFGDSQFGRLIE